MSVTTLNSDNFDSFVKNSTKPILIDFCASWCGPCRMLSPVVDQISEENSEKYSVAKVNIDDEPDLATQFKVMSIPTLIVIKNGKVTNMAVGVKPKEAILKMLEE